MDPYPALVYGLSFALGIASALLQMPYLLLILPSFLFFTSGIKRFLAPLIGSIAWMITAISYPEPEIAQEGSWGYAEISIDRLSLQTTRKGRQYIYRGLLKNFWEEDRLIAQNAPFYLTFTEKTRVHPQANSDYLLYCKVVKSNGKVLLLQQTERSEWIPLPYTFSLAEWRYQAKKWVNDAIKSQFHSPPVQSFLSGIVTGEFDDRELFASFKELGLLHLLAISGFHFNILAGLLSFFLGKILPEKYQSQALILILSLYFLFLGLGPSVLRAWMTILLFYSAAFAGRFSDPLNSLGVGLFFSLLINPYLFLNVGFQFSFLTTGAILLLNHPVSSILDRLFPKYPLETVLQFPVSSKHAYLLLRFSLSSLSLTIATSLAAFPLSLGLFGSFPLLSLAYNLFFPFLVSVSVSLLVAGLLFTPISPLSWLIHKTNDYFTSFILNLTYYD